jgi:hypothetical protein
MPSSSTLNKYEYYFTIGIEIRFSFVALEMLKYIEWRPTSSFVHAGLQ